MLGDYYENEPKAERKTMTQEQEKSREGATFVGEWEQTMDSSKTTWLRPDVRGGVYAECWQFHGTEVWYADPSDMGEYPTLSEAKRACDISLVAAGKMLPNGESL